MKLSDEQMVLDAASLAAVAHDGVYRRDSRPYIAHAMRVALRTQDFTEGTPYWYLAKTAAMLHDVIEDTEYTFEDLEVMGYSDLLIGVLRLLTHDKETDTYAEYIMKIWDAYDAGTTEGIIARAVKLADLKDNSENNPINRYIKAMVVLGAA